MGTLLIACPSCSCHAFARETHCPGCGAPLRESDGSIQRTAGAVLLGLSLTVGTAACQPEVRPGPGAGGASSMGGFQAMSAYGVGPTTTGGGFDGGSPSGMGGYQAVSAYGAGPTFSGGNGGGGTTSGGGNGGGGTTSGGGNGGGGTTSGGGNGGGP